MGRIDEHTFKKVKGGIFWKLTPHQAAAKYDISVKTVLQIRGSHDYKQYKEQVKAQHPEVQYSLAESVHQLHDIVFNKHDNKYIPKPTARKAAQSLKLHFLKEKRNAEKANDTSPKTSTPTKTH